MKTYKATGLTVLILIFIAVIYYTFPQPLQQADTDILPYEEMLEIINDNMDSDGSAGNVEDDLTADELIALEAIEDSTSAIPSANPEQSNGSGEVIVTENVIITGIEERLNSRLDSAEPSIEVRSTQDVVPAIPTIPDIPDLRNPADMPAPAARHIEPPGQLQVPNIQMPNPNDRNRSREIYFPGFD